MRSRLQKLIRDNFTSSILKFTYILLFPSEQMKFSAEPRAEQITAAMGSLLGLPAAGLPILMAYDHARAGRFVSRILFTAARRRWRETRSLVAAVVESEAAA